MSQRKTQTRKASGLKLTAPTALRYNGSVKGSLQNQSTQPIEVLISLYIPEAARNNIYFAGPSTPAANSTGANNTAQFPSYAALYDEFRVLGLQVIVAPVNPGLVGFMAAFRSVEDPPALGTSFSDFCQLAGFKFCSTVQQTSMSVKMDGADEAEWLSTDTTTAATDFKYTGICVGANAANYVTAVATWRVQFRSTKPVAQSVARRRVQDLTFKLEEELILGEDVEDEESHPVLLTKAQRELLRSSLKL